MDRELSSRWCSAFSHRTYSELMIALWQMIFATLDLALGWVCLEAAPINWTAPMIGVLPAALQQGEYPTPVEATGMTLIGIALAMRAWSPQASDPASTA